MARNEYRDRAEHEAIELLKKPELVARLAERAKRRAGRYRQRLDQVFDELQAIIRLVRAWAAGRYRQVPIKTLVSLIGALVYFMLPLDTVPDFLFAFGLLDDAAIIAHVVQRFRRDIDAFRAWEQQEGGSQESSREQDNNNDKGGGEDDARR